MVRRAISLGAMLTVLTCPTFAESKVDLLVEGILVHTDQDFDWLSPWFEGGVGVLRWGHEENGKPHISQGLAQVQQSITDNMDFHLTANYAPDGEEQFGVSESYLDYRPLSAGLKHRVKLGFFYPKFSLENTDKGWTSPYHFTYSAINSWLGEELRTLGIEYQLTRGGRQHRSPHSYGLTVSAFAANDGLGSLLAWRGWALHQRQTVLGEKVHFANYFAFQNNPAPNPTYVAPFKETDDRLGYYLGLNWRYLRQSDVRLYYYDNQADPMAIEPDRQYAWRTKFTSISFLHKFNKQWRMLGQWMDGDTAMGDLYKGVYADFNAWYLLISCHRGTFRYSFRYDNFKVTDTDHNNMDPNSSKGDAITMTWRSKLKDNLHLGLEFTHILSTNENRELWPNWPARGEQHQLMLNVQFRY